MKNSIFILVLFSVFSCKTNTSNTNINQDVIQDYSNIFSIDENLKLSKKIIHYETQSTNQICVYTIDSIPNKENTLFHATKIANKIGVGTKEKNNGLLILIARYDRQIAISTGYGTEKIITDSIAKTIIENTIIPKFKESLYYDGINTALDSIIETWH